MEPARADAQPARRARWGATVWRVAWGATATADGLRIWAGSHVERELLELKWARLELQYPLGLEYDASY